METAYVLIRTSPGHERDVYYRLYNLKGINGGVAEVHPVIGEYNLVVKIMAESFEKLGYVVVDKINHIEDIRCTLVAGTVIALDSDTSNDPISVRGEEDTKTESGSI